ncbi:MAG: DUF2798 domain-containing protein [Arenimonas sp.]
MKISQRWAPALFGLILSGLMSMLVSSIATLRAVGFDHVSLTAWLTTWLSSWAVAFPAVLILAPITRRLVARLVKD